jgi:hypothetical protein
MMWAGGDRGGGGGLFGGSGGVSEPRRQDQNHQLEGSYFLSFFLISPNFKNLKWKMMWSMAHRMPGFI